MDKQQMKNPEMKTIGRYYAKDAVNQRGSITYRKNGSHFNNLELTGAKGGGFLDFSDPIEDVSTHLNTIPAGRDSCSWEIVVPKDGFYRLAFRYNNPGFQMGGHRNFRDERNCCVMLDTPDSELLGEEGWLGWMIFNVSGYRDQSDNDKLQEYETIAGNTCWNLNFMNCRLTAGNHRLTLVLEAPPGQAVYDGPNIDYLEISEIREDNRLASNIPQLSENHQFCHDGLLLTWNRCKELRLLWNQKERGVTQALSQLFDTELGSLTYKPHTISRIDVGPYNNPNHGGEEWTKDCIASHYHAILWAITKDVRHGEKVIEILNHWVENDPEVAEGNDLKLRFSLVGLDMVSAAEIIRRWYNTDPEIPKEKRWSDINIAAFENFLQRKIYHKTKAFYPQANGNWDAIIGAFNMAVCIFCEDQVGFNRCLRQFYMGDAATTNALSMGALPNYIYPSGESQESNRDQIHARMGLTGLCHQGWIAGGQGVDLFSAYEERLLQGVKYNASYQIGEKVPSETFISDRGRMTNDIASMCYEIIIGWYSDRKNELTDVRLACQKMLRDGVNNEAKLPASYWGWLLFGSR